MPKKFTCTFKFFVILGLSFLLLALPEKKVVTLESLLYEMIDRTALTYFPQPKYLLKQFSSYDRRSTVPGGKNWWANEDWSNFIREEYNNGRREFVLFDAEGPGAVVRFWMTFSGKGASDGILRIYIDGSKVPAIEGKVLDIIGGTYLAPPPLSTSLPPAADFEKRGRNLYLPIPYAKHCKITYECDAVRFEKGHLEPKIYYNINYRTYEKGTEVKSFSLEELNRLKPLVKRVCETLLNPPVEGREYLRKSKVLAPSEKLEIKISEKGKAISKIGLKINAKNLRQTLRSTALSISFDGKQTVWIPAGEFFGTGYELHPSKTWFTEVDENGYMQAFWIMPFKRSSTIRLINYGNQKVDVTLDVFLTDYKWKQSSMYFSAAWHELRAVSTASKEDLSGDDWHFDINFVHLKGKGVYVGDAVTVFNTVNIWWGEGDEKIYVDGEKFPSCFGTGTEDYYGYAWCRPEKFTHPFVAQPTGAGNFNPGMTVNLRFRVLDAIPFEKEISSNIELWHWVKTKINYALNAFWYEKEGCVRNVLPDVEAVKKPVPLKRFDVVKPVVGPDGRLEGEDLEVLSCSGGTFSIKYGSFLSGHIQLLWEKGRAGDELKTHFILNEAGKYKISIRLTKGPSYGKVQFILNGKHISKPIDCYSKKGPAPFETTLGTFHLPKGTNTLTIKLLLPTKSAKPENKVGIDLLTFEKLE